MRVKIILFQLLIFFSIISVFAQNIEPQRFKLYGTVMDVRTNKPASKVSFTLLPYKREVKTDNEGQFLLNVPAGKIQLFFDEFPFDRQEISLDLHRDTTIVITLTSPFEYKRIEEVEVIANKPVNDKIASIERLDKQFFLTSPAMLGERDLIKTLSLTAGVSTSSEASADLQVRGGTQGQNLFLMNDIPLYFTQHALGLTSAYNPTIVQSAELYKAGFPACYGDKISSVIDVKTIEPSLTKRSGEFEIGLISSKAFINLPLKKDKLGIYVSGRVSNFTPLLALISTFTEKNNTHFGISFSDINAGLKYKMDEKNTLNFDFFRIGDNWNVKQDDISGLITFLKDNSQMNFALNWKSDFNSSVNNKLLVYFDSYTSTQNNKTVAELEAHSKKTYLQEYGTNISTINISDKIEWKLNQKINIVAGIDFKNYKINPLYINFSDSIKINANYKPAYLNEFVLFGQSDINITDKQKLTVGLRTSAMFEKKAFYNLEPRVSYQVQLPNNYSLSSSLSRMTQPIHRVANSGLGFPTEIYVSSNANLPPEKSWITSLGMSKEIHGLNNQISFKSDIWYKKMEDILEFFDGMDAYKMVTTGYNVYDKNQQVVTPGKETAYGVDFSFSLSKKHTAVFADYTLMHALSQFADLNFGKPFNSPTDIRNVFTITVSQKLSPTLLLSVNWQFNSGRPITIPTYVLPKPQTDFTNNNVSYSNSDFIFLYTERSNYRAKPFHKLDISFTNNFLLWKKYQSFATFGLYNVYNQSNPFSYVMTVKKDGNDKYIPVLESISVFPIIPMFSLRVSF